MAKETLKNNNTVEVVGNIATDITSETINSGFDNEKKRFSISTRVIANKPTTIATLKLTASENKRFLKSSNKGSNLNSYLKMVINNVERDSNNNITNYLYDLVYIGKESISKAKKLRYTLINEAKGIVTKATGISRVTFGETNISEAGETRVITVHGTPGSEFKIAVNKITDNKDSDDNIVNSTEQSIISNTVSNSTIINNEGEMNIIHRKLDPSGKHSFIQKIDKTISDIRYSINVLPTSIFPKFNSGKIWDTDRSGWENWYSKILYQYINPTLTLRVTKTTDRYSINNGSASINTYDYVYKGERDAHVSGVKYNFIVKYTLKAPSHNITTDSGGSSPGGDGVPIFSNTTQTSSDWTNSVHGGEVNNGGTEIEITNVTASGSGTSTYILTFGVNIIKFGSKSVIMALDLDTVVNV